MNMYWKIRFLLATGEEIEIMQSKKLYCNLFTALENGLSKLFCRNNSADKLIRITIQEV